MLYTSVAIAGHDRVSALGLNPGTETVEASKLIVDTFLPLPLHSPTWDESVFFYFSYFFGFYWIYLHKFYKIHKVVIPTRNNETILMSPAKGASDGENSSFSALSITSPSHMATIHTQRSTGYYERIFFLLSFSITFRTIERNASAVSGIRFTIE